MTSAPAAGAVRVVPWARTERNPTRCVVERYEYSDCWRRQVWRALGTYDSEASALSVFPNATINKELCPKDGKPCYAGGRDDKHYRCGTVQCGAKTDNQP